MLHNLTSQVLELYRLNEIIVTALNFLSSQFTSLYLCFLLHVLIPAVGYALLFFCTCFSFHPLWVRSFPPAVGPLFSVIHHDVLDQHPSRCSGSQASCHQDHPSVRVHPVCVS